jgi:hypothetical protein
MVLRDVRSKQRTGTPIHLCEQVSGVPVETHHAVAAAANVISSMVGERVGQMGPDAVADGDAKAGSRHTHSVPVCDIASPSWPSPAAQ